MKDIDSRDRLPLRGRAQERELGPIPTGVFSSRLRSDDMLNQGDRVSIRHGGLMP
jgi:hypothetical protein